MVNIAINGFGRIGRNVLRACVERKLTDFKIKLINELAPIEASAHLFRYDSVHGPFHGEVSVTGTTLSVKEQRIAMTALKDPEAIPYQDHKIDVVLECTGKFTERTQAERHLKGRNGLRVIVSAPSKGADRTIVYGVNQQLLDEQAKVISVGSCTTNCLAPVVHLLHKTFGINSGFMTTIHSYTNDQALLDQYHKNLYRSRAAAMSIIPTTTGAAKTIGLIIPELEGKLDGVSMRVPTPNVSAVDLTFVAQKDLTIEAINAIFKEAADGDMKGIVFCTEVPNVSHDFTHHSASAIVHCDQTRVVGSRLGRVLAWYDNEWGFSNRMLDIVLSMSWLGKRK